MKKLLCIAIAAVIAVSAMMLVGCNPTYDKSPSEFTDIRWSAPDYSFIINPKDSCKGTYKFGEKKYNIRAKFDNSDISILDTDKNNKELFYGKWSYDKDGRLYIYNISFNTDDYKELKDNYAEYVTLNKEPVK